MLRIRKIRKYRGMKAEEAAAFLKLPYSTYMSYEQGAREPSMATVFKMCFLFNCTADYLYGRSEVPDMYPLPYSRPLAME